MFTRHRRSLRGTTTRPALALAAAATLIAGAGIVATTAPTRVENISFTDATAGPVHATVDQAAFGDGDTIVVDDAAITSQGEEPGPKAVKEFTRETPFSMVALTWSGDHDIAAFFRAQKEDGTWGEWFDAEVLSEKESTAVQGTEPIYVGTTTRLQVSTAGVDAQEPPADLNAVFIDGGDDSDTQGGIELTADDSPLTRVVSRAAWGADESLRCSTPTIDDKVSAVTIHHTAGENNYTKAQAKGIMRGIYTYHAQTLGWCDIGYNALVDKFGTIYEGRYGGLKNAVQGAHAGGFNENTWGISMIGNYSTISPSAATLRAVGELAGWKAYVSGFDPTGYDQHTSEGTSFSKYAYGQTVTLPNIFAHRDVGNTECPGNVGYTHMDEIRSIAKKKYDSLGSGTDTGTVTVPSPTTGTGTAPDGLGTGALSQLIGSSTSGSSGDTAPAATTGTGTTTGGTTTTGGDLASLQNDVKDVIDAVNTIKTSIDGFREAGLIK